MSIITSPRELRNCTNPVEVFEECLQDIRDGLWICGQLSRQREICNIRKPYGCAVGIVGINSGNCTLEFDRESNIVWAEWKGETAENFDDLGRECIFLLARALRNIKPSYMLGYDPEVLDDAENRIVEYNDGGDKSGKNITPEKAEQWFLEAHKLAIQSTNA